MAISKDTPSIAAPQPQTHNPRGGDGIALKTTVQMGMLISVSLVVAGILWIRDTRSAAFTGAEDQVWEHSYGPIDLPLVTGEDLPLGSRTMIADLKPLADIGSTQQIEERFPVGTTYCVTIHGGFISRLKDSDYGNVRRVNLVYAFEMRYRRTIESNDGERIVELRQFDAVRMAKILSPAENMRLALGSPAEPKLNLDHMPFVGPGEGMSIAEPAQVAAAVLERGVEEVAANSAGRAFLEEDVLSGKSVRLTYVDGVGLESIEPLGWTITKPTAHSLFTQPASLSTSLPHHSEKKRAQKTCDISQLGVLLPAPFAPIGAMRVAIEPMADGDGGGSRYRVVLLLEERTKRRRNCDRHGPHLTSLTMGELRFDRSDTYVAEAAIQWPLAELDSSPYRLLYESAADLQDQPNLSIQYHCMTEPRASE